MEHYSYLFCELRCPICSTRFEDNQGHVRFFWGCLGAEYHIGDHIQWPGRDSGLVAQVRRTLGLMKDTRGVPGYARVYVFDNDDDYCNWQCRNCQTSFDRPAILIENDRIMSVTLFCENEEKDMLGMDRNDHDVFFFDPTDNEWVILEDVP
jgi:hypothetical protein